MARIEPYLFPLLWLAWGVYWKLRARGVKDNVWREPIASRLMHIVPLVVAAVLLLLPTLPVLGLDEQLWPQSRWTFWCGWLLSVAGLLFTVWARRHLATNWSGTVTIKADHDLIITGPYALVRHPIYTGLLLAFIGSAVSLGQPRAVLAVVIVGLALWRKLRMEERGMRQVFGETYANYERRVKALIPLVL